VADKSRKQDRRAVLEELRDQQRSTSRRRALLIVGVGGVIAATIIGFAIYGVLHERAQTKAFDSLPLDDIGAAASTCGEVTTQETDGSHEHPSTKTQITYDTAPPAYGPHWAQPDLAPAPFSTKFYTEKDRPELEALVHNLEHGYTILWYDDSVAGSDQLDEVRGIAAPWTAEDADESGAFPDGMHLALSHWSAGGEGETDIPKERGVYQYCGEPSGAAVKEFMSQYPYSDSPEPKAP